MNIVILLTSFLTLYKSYSVCSFAIKNNSVAIERSRMHQYSTHDMPGHTIASAHAQTWQVSINVPIDIVHFVAVNVSCVG